jgi:hypothetical protein
MRKLTPLIFSFILFSCTPESTRTNRAQSQDGYSPVYASTGDLTQIAFEPAKNTESAGKIYTIGNYLFQNDINKGIHIIDGRDKNHIKKIGFLKIPFATEVAVKGNYLYTNNLNDLVVFDISNINSPQLVKRIENVFPVVSQKYPPISNVAFECPNPAKGIVVRWEKTMLKDPKCRR